MNQQTIKELNQLFNQFANETQASSFATENLLNKVIRIIKENEQQKEIKEVD